MSGATVHSFWTVVMLLVFVGIIVWAWSSKRKRFFNDAANLPFADDKTAELSVIDLQKEENKHE